MSIGSSVNDALVATSDYVQENASHQRKAIFVITDGVEKNSSLDFKNTEKILAENSVRVFLLALPYKSSESISPKQLEKNKEWFNYLAALTGGEIYFPTPEVDLMLFISRFLGIARNSYLLSYRSSNQIRGSGLRTLQFKLSTADQRKFNIYTRHSYSVPK